MDQSKEIIAPKAVTVTKKVIIVSGGMDSVTLLYWGVKNFGKENILALSFEYGSRHNAKEIPFARYHTDKLGVIHNVISLVEPFSHFKSNLLQGQGEIPEGHYAQDNMSQTIVPNRNMIMLSIAGGYAESVDATEIWLGSHHGDHAVYPDCRPEFTSAVSKAINLASDGKIRIMSPFNDMTKTQICKKGLEELDVNYKKTWSCYKGGEEHCYRCGTCVERVETFIQNNTMDPACSSGETWREATKFYFDSVDQYKHKQGV